jgi:hypothetical protein
MSYLQPTEKRSFAVHSGTEGHDTMKLSAELHVFPCNKTPRQRMAILFSHSTGFHKESLHPVMRRLKTHLRSLSRYDDTEIHFVAWDARNHGDSARLNEGKFSEQCKFPAGFFFVLDNVQLTFFGFVFQIPGLIM